MPSSRLPLWSAPLALITAVAVASPAAAAIALGPAPASTEESAACLVVDGTLTWGFKESFRSYISGSIARGTWEPQGSASYETPNFIWQGPTGAFDEQGVGIADFSGDVQFSGHDGLLDTKIGRPSLHITGEGEAQLLLDVSGTPMEDALEGEANVQTHEAVPFVDVDLSAMQSSRAGDRVTYTVADAPTAVTAEGFAAFGSYEAGTAFDPVSFTVTVECAPEPAAPEPSSAPAATSAAPVEQATSTADVAAADRGDSADSSPWIWAGGAVALLAAGGIVWLARRRARQTESPARTPSREGTDESELEQ